MASLLPLDGTRAYAAVRLRRKLFGPAGMSLAVILILLPAALLSLRERSLLPIAGMTAGLIFLLHVPRRFLEERLEDESLPLDRTLLTASLATALVAASPKPDIGMGDVLRAAVLSRRGRFLLHEIGIEPAAFLQATLPAVESSVETAAFLTAARDTLASSGERRVDAPVILQLLFEYVPACREVLEKAGLPQEELPGLLRWEAFRHHFRAHVPLFSLATLRSVSVGRLWVSGYTPALDALAQEMHLEPAETGEQSVMIRPSKIEAILRVLSRSQRNNVLLIGPIGVGKRRLVENALRTLHGVERGHNLPFTRALQLRTDQLLAGTGDPDGAFLSALYKAQHGGRIILVIRDLAMLIKASNPRLQTVLLKCLQMGSLSVAGIVDTQDYHGIVKVHPEIDSLFEKIEVENSADEETLQVLMAHASAHHGGPILSYKAARSVLELSRRYVTTGAFPAVALQVYEDAAGHARSRRDSVIREEDVRAAVSQKAKMNVQAMSEDERQRLLILEETLQKTIVGQEPAVKAVANALKRARLDLHERKKPIGTFLFLGQTGVGKTHTAKVLAEHYFGSAEAMIRLDMNEFSHADSVFDIVGSTTSGKGDGFLAQRVQDRPFSLILLDEIEKAHPSVLNLFLQVLDEGMLTDARGVRTSFRNTIIIATSNAGALFIRDTIRANPRIDPDTLKTQLIDHVLKEKAFSPEFMNRFDEVILFQPLSTGVVKKIASLMLGGILEEIRRKRGIQVEVAPELLDALVAHGYSSEFGAREMYRTILTKVEDALANYLLQNDVERGGRLLLR